jgi:hypothetical protein
MSNVVISYPVLPTSDFDRIQNLRKIHDRLYEVVSPHFTFVFPTTKLSIEDLVAHTKLKAADAHKIAIVLTKAIVVEDDSKKFYHTFLVPSDGEKEVTTLHDVLYTGALASELRLDIPFIPHVGIGSGDAAAMKKLADEVNVEGVNIQGSIDTLVVANYDGKTVNDVERIQLK